MSHEKDKPALFHSKIPIAHIFMLWCSVFTRSNIRMHPTKIQSHHSAVLYCVTVKGNCMHYRASAMHSVTNRKRISIICCPSQAVNTSNALGSRSDIGSKPTIRADVSQSKIQECSPLVKRA